MQGRSNFERRVRAELDALGVEYTYEPFAIPYRTSPEGRLRHFTPDILLANGVALEVKGRMTRDNLATFRAIRRTYPELDLRFLIMRPGVPVTKRQGSSIEGWCRRYGYPVAIGSVPASWLAEPPNAQREAALSKFRDTRRVAA